VGYFYEHSMEDLTWLIKEMMNMVVNELKFPGTILLRMNAPGHQNCEHATGPLPSASSDDKAFAPYNWNRLSWEIDDVMAAAIQDAPRSMVLNTTMHRLRPDGKHIHEGYGGAIDCLHSCLPGPVDMYSRILVNMLEQKVL
jgi:hypothetical protein